MNTQTGPIGWRWSDGVKAAAVASADILVFVPHGDESGFANATLSGVFESEAAALPPLQPTPSSSYALLAPRSSRVHRHLQIMLYKHIFRPFFFAPLQNV